MSIISVGQQGVDLFFILSSFLIFGSVTKSFSFPSFAVKRAHRIFPAHLIAIAVLVITYAASFYGLCSAWF